MKNSIARLLVGFAALLGAAPHVSVAQLAPVGAHHAGLGPDNGGGGSYAASVPLDLPPARGALPVPVSVVHGASRFGAAGRGWDVPLSFVREDRSFAHRRPQAGTNGVPVVPTKVQLALLGRTVELVPDGSVWVPQRAPASLTAQRVGDEWKVYDGDGNTYVFARRATDELWLLSRIEGQDQSRVELEYAVNTHEIDDEKFTHNGSTWDGSPGYAGIAIDLVGVRYNHSPSGSPKHEVILEYNPASAEPLSLSVLGSSVLVRMRTLARIDVRSRAAAGAAAQTLRRYDLSYVADPDTRTPRLDAVTLRGQAGTPEAETPLPVARYEYGRATTEGSAGTELRYALSHMVAPPVAGTAPLAAAEKASSGLSVTARLFDDVTGDGRADLVYPSASGLTVARQRPGANGAPVLNDASLIGTFNDATMAENHLAALGTKKLPATYEDAHGNSYQTESVVDTWREFRDVNGDGRPDLLVAADNYRWIAYINSPAATFPHNTRWVRRDYDMSTLAQKLRAGGHVIDGTKLPLMRQRTGREFDTYTCWRNNAEVEVDAPVGTCHATQVAEWLGETTLTEWQLVDFNGDDGLDVVLNTRPAWTARIDVVTPSGCLPCSTGGVRQFRMAVKTGNALQVVFNVNTFNAVPAGSPTTQPVALTGMMLPAWQHDRAMLVEPGAEPGQVVGGLQYADPGWADVNGDGLIDQVTWRSKYVRGSSTPSGVDLVYYRAAYLGTGSGISKAYIVLPNHVSIYYNLLEHQCGNGAAEYDSRYSSQLRDVTGDGIPDLVLATAKKVRVGTGVGFGALIPVNSAEFEISQTRNACSGAWSKTWAGLYEMDGDGRPEIVRTNAQGRYEVYQLVGSSGARALSAGLLTAIDNGYGARTEIGYKSAKDDGSTYHQSPHAEIVVASVRTKQASNGSVAETKYAYGNPLFAFDPIAARFRSFGYARSVSLVQVEPGKGNATVTDAYGLEPTFATDQLRFARVLKAGSVRDVTTFSGALADPWALLTANVETDTRRTGSSHRDYDGKFWYGGTSEPGCPYIDHPYAATSGEAVFSAMNACRSRGFSFVSGGSSWRGSSGPTTDFNVKTHGQVRTIDDLGRVTQFYDGGDSRRADDDVCVNTGYAVSSDPGYPRVLSAVAARSVKSANTSGTCGSTLLAADRFAYDDLPVGQVSAGRLTSHTVDRVQNGVVLDEIRTVEVGYNDRGQVTSTTTKSGDGRTRVNRVSAFDAFGLLGTTFTVEADGALPQQTELVLDPATLLPLRVRNADGLVVGSAHDGFGRPVSTSVERPDGGTSGVLSVTSYHGFDGLHADGRHIVEKVFENPVAEQATGVARGRTTTVYLDDFGRATSAMADLGSDYPKDLVVRATLYDEFGRVAFVADPFPQEEEPTTAYGTTFLYNVDGTLKCSVRGRGPQPSVPGLTLPTDEAQERYPTCFMRGFRAGQEVLSSYAPDALLAGSPQAGVFREVAKSAIGRTLSTSTWAATRLEHASFAYDRLGHTTTMTRYKDPEAAVPSQGVPWTFAYDSLGRLQRLAEPATAARLYTYSHWDELVKVATEQDPHVPAPEQTEIMEYDGLGRLIRSEQHDNDGPVPGTAYDYGYDVAVAVHDAVPTGYALGRLTKARSDFGTAYFGYDAMGRTVAVAHRDPGDKLYIETMEYDGDGMPTARGALLPDTGHRPERIEYTYDSARRLTHAVFNDQDGKTKDLYAVTEMDPLGRVLKATIGRAGYVADYAPQGRRLLRSVEVESAGGRTWRVDLAGYDSMGRERGRTERFADDSAATTYGYDRIGRLASSMRTGDAGTQAHRTFAYDALGNIRQQTDVLGDDDVDMSQRTDNRDRLCSVGYGTTAGTSCDVEHDALGRITQQPGPSGKRSLSYLPSGRTHRIETSDATATLRYGAFGEVQELDVDGDVDRRRDRRYGPFELRETRPGEQTLARSFAFGGLLATRRGSGGEWTFALGEARGMRLTLDADGDFVQTVGYDAFGNISSAGATPDDPRYARDQWNGGDHLAAFGLSQLGARMYDPATGRFLSPDPLVLVRTAAQSNPYAFAYNDPVNASDPTGLCPEGCSPESGLPRFEPFPSGCGFTMSCLPPPPVSLPRFTPTAPPAQPEAADPLFDAMQRAKPVDIAQFQAVSANDGMVYVGSTQRRVPFDIVVAQQLRGPLDTFASIGDPLDIVEEGGRGVLPYRAQALQNRANALREFKPEKPWKPNQIGEGIKRLNEADRLERRARSSHPINHRGLRTVARVAKAADIVEVGLAGIDLIDNPNAENAYNFTKTCAGVWLMGQGPIGWAVKFTVIPNAEMAVNYVTATDRTGLASDVVKAERAIVRGLVNLPF